MKLKSNPAKFALLICGLIVSLNSPANKPVKIRFDSSREISGQKFAIRDISPGLPENWDGYNYVVLEFRISTPQRFHIGFTTDWGYNELRMMSYTPGGWNKLAIPLKLYRQLPGAASDLAATYNQPRYTGWINLGGKRGPLHDVDSIGIRMRMPIGNPTFELRSVTLAIEDPGDEYLGKKPVVDEFGQWAPGKYEGKVRSLKQLQKEWEAEENETVSTESYHYSNYGGYLQVKQEATGFFRTEKIDGRWWFVDPEGYLFLSVGVDCVAPGGGGNVKHLEKRRNLFKELPPGDMGSFLSRPGSASFGTWNLFRRYGEDFRIQAGEMIIKRMDKWGLNTIGNWSSQEIYGMNRKAFMLEMRGIGVEGGLMGLPDVYVPGFAEKTDAACKSFCGPYRNNPWLIGYFTANEPSWHGQESRLCQMILDGEDRPVKTALKAWLAGSDTPEKRKQFIFDTFRIFLKTVDESIAKYDPNHLNLGIRFGNVSGMEREILEICGEIFDVFSFNCYDLFPKKEMMDRAMEITGLPMIIGEYHFGTVDRGMAQSLWQVDNQQERGVAYRYYTERAYAHPGLIGTAWFQWCDQDLLGRRDGENYNCGYIDVTDRPYKHLIEAVSETSKRLFDIHSGKTEPVQQVPARARGNGGMPDGWK